MCHENMAELDLSKKNILTQFVFKNLLNDELYKGFKAAIFQYVVQNKYLFRI
jgi:hypothetical protein